MSGGSQATQQAAAKATAQAPAHAAASTTAAGAAQAQASAQASASAQAPAQGAAKSAAPARTGPEQIWYMDPRGFIDGYNFADIIPNGSMTYARQLNAVMRFSLYYAAAVSLVRLSPESFVVPLAAAVVTYLLYEGCRPIETGAMGGVSALKTGQVDALLEPAPHGGVCKKPNAGEDGSMSRGWLKTAAGGYGGAGGGGGGSGSGGGGGSCIRSTRDNPFMNQPPLDPEMFSKESCDPLRSEIKRQMRDNFQRDLFRDTDDLFERGNSERQFFTMPSNQPEDQTEFAKWIYGGEDMGGRATKPPWNSGEPHPSPSGSGRACGYW